MKNKTALFASLGILLVVLIGGGIFFIIELTKSSPQTLQEEPQTELPLVDASVEIDLQAKADGKSVTLTIAKIPENTTSIEFELSYITDKGIRQQAEGKIDPKSASEVTREITLGSCSTKTCTYDTGVKSVNLVLRFNSTKGSSQFTKEYVLE